MANLTIGTFDQPAFGTSTQKQPAAPQKKSGGLGGLLKNVGHSLVAAPKYFAEADIVNPIRETAAQVTGNKQALSNARNAANENLAVTKDGKGQSASVGLKRLAGNTATLASEIVPGGQTAGVLGKAAQGARYGFAGGAGQSLANGDSVEDALVSGVEGAGAGGALGGVGGALGKGIRGAGNVAAGHLENTAAKDAQNALASIHEPFQGVPKKVLQNKNLNGVINNFKSLDISPTPHNMHAAADLVTGSNGVTTGTVRQILGNVGKVDIGGVEDDAKSALIKEAGQLGNAEDKGSAGNGVLRSIRNTIQGVANKGEGSLDSKAEANDVLDTVQNLEKRIDELGGTRATGANGAEARVLKATRDSLESRIADNGGDDAVAGHTLNPEDVAGVQKAVTNVGGSPALSDHIINGINNARSLRELRALQKPFVDASHLAEASDKATGGQLAKPFTKGAPTTAETAVNVGTNLALGNHFGIAQNAGKAISGSGIIDKLSGKTSSAVTKGINTSTRAGSIVNTPRVAATAGNVIGQANSPQSDDGTTTAVDPSTDQTATDDTGWQQLAGATDTDGNTLGGDTSTDTDSGISKNQLVALVAADPKNASTYISLYNAVKPPASSTKTTASAQKAVAGAKQAKATLGSIENQYQAAGGGQGRVSGVLANLSGKAGFNDQAKAYNDTAVSLGASLYKALGNTGTITDNDQKRIASLIPKTTDTPGEAKAKLSQLEDLLSEAQSNAQDMQ